MDPAGPNWTPKLVWSVTVQTEVQQVNWMQARCDTEHIKVLAVESSQRTQVTCAQWKKSLHDFRELRVRELLSNLPRALGPGPLTTVTDKCCVIDMGTKHS